MDGKRLGFPRPLTSRKGAGGGSPSGSRVLAVALVATAMLACTHSLALARPLPARKTPAPPKVRKLRLPKLVAPKTVIATSGNLSNTVTWSAVVSRRLGGYAVYRASSPAGPFTKVASLSASARSYTDPISSAALGVYYYKVAAVEKSRASGTLSAPRSADRVVLSATVDPLSATPIIASTGELILDIPAGAVSAPTQITVAEKDYPGALNSVDRAYTNSYDFGPDGLSFNPAALPRLSLAYTPFSQGATFEEKWVAKTSNLYVYDETSFAWAQVTQGMSVDTQNKMVSASLSHFSQYADTFLYQPHGTSSSTTNMCLVCHDLHGSLTSAVIRRTAYEACLYCHGAPTPGGDTTATMGPNIQAEFYLASGQTTASHSYHPTPERKVGCVDCHTPHYNPNDYPKLLYYWAPLSPGSASITRWYNTRPGVTGTRRTELTPGAGQGNKNCFGCHGPFRNPRITKGDGAPELPADNYWTRTGGDHSTDMSGTGGFYAMNAHGSIENTYSPPASSYGATSSISSVSSEVQCMKCHNDHGRSSAGQDSIDSLLNATVGTVTVTSSGNDWCFACHIGVTDGYPVPSRDASGYPDKITAEGFRSGGGTWPGKASFNSTSSVPSHIGNPHGTTNTVWPAAALGYKGGDCRNCHDTHVTQTAQYYDFLRARYSTGKGPETNAQAFAICFTCHGTSGNPTGAADIIQYYGAGAGHAISTAASLTAGDGLPCYECHQPHGSKTGSTWAISDERWSNINAGTYSDGSTGVNDQNGNSVNDARDFCFGCHLAFDDATVTAGKVVGIDRQLVASKLKITDKVEHRLAATTKNCKACHMSPHDPSAGESNGGQLCGGCHSTYSTMASSTAGYHHVLPSASWDATSYTNVAQPSLMTTTSTDRRCLMCHVDHDVFTKSLNPASSGRSRNLRSGINVTVSSADPNTFWNSDYSSTQTAKGICLSCHGGAALVKNTTLQKSDGTTQTVTQKIDSASFVAATTGHNYSVTSTFSTDNSIFTANCGKCHTDNLPKSFQSGAATPPRQFGTHYAPVRNLLAQLGLPGGSYADPLQETFCYECHQTGGPVAGKDYYGAQNMSAASRALEDSFTGGSVKSKHPVDAGSVKIECESCHNPHVSTASTPAVDPRNTYNGVSIDTTATKNNFCLNCHAGGTLPASQVSSNTYVPYTIVVANPATANVNAFYSASGHGSAAGGTKHCMECHDQHASTNYKLVAPSINATPVSGNDKSTCYACHLDATSLYPGSTYATGYPSRDASGYPTQGTWPGATYYSVAYSAANHTGNAHGTSNGVYPGSGYAGGDCKNCHDPHGSGNMSMLATRYASGKGTEDAGTAFDMCFKCHSAGSGVTGAADIKQFYTAADSGAGHKLQASSATATLASGDHLPCYDCHTPHGSKNGNRWMISDERANNIDPGVDSGTGAGFDQNANGVNDNRDFCFGCHVASDNTTQWGTIEGLSRQGWGLKLPATVNEHKQSDGNYNDDACRSCHGSDYAPGGRNIHNPSPGISNGGLTCYTCHSSYKQYMEDGSGAATGSARTTYYHHVLGGTWDGDTATPDGTGNYPTSTSEVYCISCHTDHNNFNSNRAANMRTDIADTGGSGNNSDYFTSSPYGVCVSCHSTGALQKDTANQKYVSGDNTQTQVINGGRYQVSKHRYGVTATFTADGSIFTADCAKCHTENAPKSFQSSAVPRRFSTHYGPVQSLLAELGLGAGYTDPLQERFCYECHQTGGPVANMDYYGVASMSASSQAVEASFTSGSTKSKHPIDSGTVKVECESCHNVHASSLTTRAANPDNTLIGQSLATTSTKTSFCSKCHDGTLPKVVSTNATYVPYAVTVSNPTTANVATYYTTRGHGATGSGGGGGSTATSTVLSATSTSDTLGKWTNDANALGAPNGASANSTVPPFDMWSYFTMPASVDTIDGATVTVRSQAKGGFGAQVVTLASTTTALPDDGAPHANAWTKVGAGNVLDDASDATYYNGSGNNSYGYATTADPSVGADTKIRVWVKARTTSTDFLDMGLYANAVTDFVGDASSNGTGNFTPAGVFTWYWEEFNGTWTAAELADMEVGFKSARNTNPVSVDVSEAYIQLITAAGSSPSDTQWTIQYSVDAGSGWSDITASNSATESALTSHTAVLTGILNNTNMNDFVVRIMGTGSDATGTVDWDSSSLFLAYTYSTDATGNVGANLSCMGCHDKHASSNTKLVKPSVNNTSVPANDSRVCYACHAAATSSYPTTSYQDNYPSRNASGYPIQGTWPGVPTWTTAFSAANHTGNAHATTNATMPGAGYAGGDCKNCHDPHGTQQPNSMLRYRMSSGKGAETATSAFDLCFKCHGDTPAVGTKDIKRHYTAAGANAGHKIQAVSTTDVLDTGDELPCYDCHTPHGSKNSNRWMISDERWNNVNPAVDDGNAAAQDQDGNSVNDNRDFCFGCHVPSDNTTATGNVEGLSRQGWALKLPATVNEHSHATVQRTKSCRVCHGSDYSSGTSNNVHNPSAGISNGGTTCYTCHSSYQAYMEDGAGAKTGASRTTVYHHVLGGAAGDGDTATPNGTGNYPTSTTDVYCISCHSDHNYFNGAKSGNLRQTITNVSGAATAATDFITATNGGICVSCHGTVALAKDTANQLNDGSTNAQKVVGSQYNDSAHQYAVTATFTTDGSTFTADCSKCHNDNLAKSYQNSPAPRRFGTHYAPVRNLLAQFGLGAAYTDPLEQKVCFECHQTGGPVAGKDYYGWQSMDATSRAVETSFTSGAVVSSHPVTLTANPTRVVECESCHNVHVSSMTTKVVDPDNTYNGFSIATTATKTDFCSKCHDGSLPTTMVADATYIPFTVRVANPATANVSAYWTYSGHGSSDPTKVAGGPKHCMECHDKHSSTLPKLVKPSINNTSTVANDQRACFTCHRLNTSNYPSSTFATGFPSRDASGFPTKGTWPGSTFYTSAYGASGHTGNAHLSANATMPGNTGYAGGDCKNCHDPHGANTPYGMTVLRFASGKGAETAASAFALCFECHDSNGPAADDIKSQYTDVADNAGHKIRSATTTATLAQNDELPCYDCHTPHGSKNSNRWMISDERWNNINAGVTTDGASGFNDQNGNAVNDNRDFCFGCHVASNITTWAGTVEGINRLAWKLKLPATASEHAWAGAQHTKSCQGCHGSPHNPTGGESAGGTTCYSCHKDYLNATEDQSLVQKGSSVATQTYHHVMGSNTTEGDTYVYPLSSTAKTDVFCLSCHVDHDLFSPIVSASNKRAANLRLQLGASAPASTADATNSDFVASTGGACLGCHNATQRKDTTAQLSIVNSLTADPSTWTPTITAADYAASAHSYDATTYFSDNSVFRANCSKCHSDVSSTDTTQGYEKGSFQFGTHQSRTRHILAQLGSADATYADAGARGPYEEWLCFGCHQGNTAAKDYYGSADMTSPARGVLTAFGKEFRHDVQKYRNLHRSDEESLAARIITSGWTYTRAGWLTAVESTKHVECTDCHNVHAARESSYSFPGTGTVKGVNTLRRSVPPTISGANYGVWGVTVNGASALGTWTAAATNTPDATTGIRNAAIPAYRWIATATVEWQLCLKCHSRAAWGSSINTPTIISGDLGVYANSTPTAMTDVGQDFAPSNFAFHPVFRQGRNQPPAAPTDNPDFGSNVTWNSSTIRRWIDHNGDNVAQAGEYANQGLSNSLVNGLVTTSTVTCSDCHNNNNSAITSSTGVSRGPHGSAKAWMIRGVDLGIKVSTWNGAVVVRTPNSGMTSTMRNNFCLNCHRADVYGWGDGSDPATADQYLSRFGHLGGGGSNSCNVYSANPATGDTPRKANWVPCYNCHGGRIGPSPYSSGGFQPSQYNRVQSGAIHGTSMAAYDGSNDTGWANNAIVGDPMGYRFCNGASWDAHDLADTAGTGVGGGSNNQIGCSTTTGNGLDAVGGCNNHTGVWGNTGDPTYFYGVGGGTGN